MTDPQPAILSPWPEDKKVPITKRDVARVLARWKKKMPEDVAELLAQKSATEDEEKALLGEADYAL